LQGEPIKGALPPGVKWLELDEAKLIRLFTRLQRIPKLLDDRTGVISLGHLLMRRDAAFVELGDEDGIVYAENIEPGGNAYIHIVVFNRRRLPDLDEQLRGLIHYAFEVFKLGYMSAWLPAFNTAAINLVTRLGFHFDGIIRLAGVYGGKRTDILIYGREPDGRG
jgi:hypothetical protein